MEAQTVVFHKLPPKVQTPMAPEQHEALKRKLERYMPSDSMRDITHNKSDLSDIGQSFTPKMDTAHHPLRGALKGTIRTSADLDLTAPADPEWADRL